jgi:hypothetical protein
VGNVLISERTAKNEHRLFPIPNRAIPNPARNLD